MTSVAIVKDECSLANSTSVTTRHIDLSWSVDFDASRVAGTVTLFVVPVSADGVAAATTIKIDAKNLEIDFESIAVARVPPESLGSLSAPFDPTSRGVAFSAPKSVAFTLAEDDKHVEAMGRGLSIELDESMALRDAAADMVAVRITYSTATDHRCLALTWLEASQTADGVAPFLYSQCQAIHARTLLPCQDTPGVRATYTATVRSKAGTTSLMSALPQPAPTAGIAAPREGLTTCVFHQPVPIASYLIAIVCGKIARRDISDRCAVYAEPSTVDRAAWEFADMETFLATTEKIAGPYRWGRYDVIVMPPSFPYGGMENPNATFVTPALIVGDRSLVEVVAHEIAHSWSGNLVGCATWNEFFLNEGFTVLLQRKVTREMQGPAMRDFEGITGWHHLQQSVDGFMEAAPEYTAMRPDLKGVDPDDAFSSVPYEKGCAFLLKLEAVVGREAFDEWLPHYFSDFAYKSVTADDMQAHFLRHFADRADEINAKVDWQRFYTERGMPSFKPDYDTSARDECIAAAKAFLDFDRTGSVDDDGPAGFTPPETWRGQQLVAFVEELLHGADPTSGLRLATLRSLDRHFKFLSAVKNSDVLCPWFQLCLQSVEATSASLGRVDGAPGTLLDFVPRLREFLASFGRMKYVRPLFSAWAKKDLDGARQWFSHCEPKLSQIARKMVRKDLKL